MRRRMLWIGVVVGAVLMARAMVLPHPWIGLPTGVLLTAGCATVLADG